MKFKKKPVVVEAFQFPDYPIAWITCKHRYANKGKR